MGRYSNPADKMSNIAAEPRTILGNDTTILQLSLACKDQLIEYTQFKASDRREIEHTGAR